MGAILEHYFHIIANLTSSINFKSNGLWYYFPHFTLDEDDDSTPVTEEQHFDNDHFQPDPTFAALKSDCVELLSAYNDMKEVQPAKLSWRERCSRSAEKWEVCRQGIMKAVLKNENCEDERLCDYCNSKHGVIRCLDCCWKVLCLKCDAVKHEGEPFHDREVMRNGFYQAVSSNVTLDEEGNITEKGNTVFANDVIISI